MYLVCDVFQLKFGKSRDAIAALQQGKNLFAADSGRSPRVLTDFAGQAYRLVLEIPFASMAEYEEMITTTMAMPEWREWYAGLVPCIESSYREIMRIVEM